MTQAAAHRGPDGEGYWLWHGGETTGQAVLTPDHVRAQPPPTVALGHRRLAIFDRSAAGHQPMGSPDGQHWLVFNGAIYNYRELRADLQAEGQIFHTGTDTEVLLAAYAQWGTACFSRLNGMWGLALVDLRRRVLVLARDRLGIKPLYIWAPPGTLAFASELKQLLTLPGCGAVADRATVQQYLATGYETPPATFFAGLTAFPPGCYAEGPLDAPGVPCPQPYWCPDTDTAFPWSDETAMSHTQGLLRDAVRLCQRADVPVGVSLSGGLDSSAILSQMPHGLAFSARFPGHACDEGRSMAQMLRATGSVGWSTTPTAASFLEEAPTFVYHHDEPPGSLSQYAGWCVMRLARQQGVPVILSGQGGDELFSGYWPAYYLWLRRLLRAHPGQALADALRALLPGGNPHLWTQALGHLRQYRFRQREAASAWATDAQHLTPEAYRLAELRLIHLPRLLKWEDRNSMAFGVEGRYPFLDHRLVDWLLTLAPARNLHAGWTKRLLRQACGPWLPRSICWRRDKIGFETPQASWMQTTLQPHLLAWSQQPSEALRTLVAPAALISLAQTVLGRRPLAAMDERPKRLMRLFFLDHWLTRFQVEVPEDACASLCGA